MQKKSSSHSSVQERHFNIQLFNRSGADGPALTCIGDAIPFSSCCKALQVHHTVPGGVVAVNCYSQWEIKDCGNESS